MGIQDDKAIDATINELRRHRAVLDELNAELKRTRARQDACWHRQSQLMTDLRENPSRETAVAYAAWVDEINGKAQSEMTGDVEERRRVVRQAMEALLKKFHAMLGVQLVPADWEMQ